MTWTPGAQCRLRRGRASEEHQHVVRTSSQSNCKALQSQGLEASNAVLRSHGTSEPKISRNLMSWRTKDGSCQIVAEESGLGGIKEREEKSNPEENIWKERHWGGKGGQQKRKEQHPVNLMKEGGRKGAWAGLGAQVLGYGGYGASSQQRNLRLRRDDTATLRTGYPLPSGAVEWKVSRRGRPSSDLTIIAGTNAPSAAVVEQEGGSQK